MARLPLEHARADTRLRRRIAESEVSAPSEFERKAAQPQGSPLSDHTLTCGTSRPVIIPLTLLLMLACASSAAGQASSWLHAEYRTGDFKLVAGTHAAD